MCPNQTSTESKLKVVAFLKKRGGGLHVLSANPFSSQSLSLHSLSLSQTLHFSISVQGRGTFIHEKQQLVDGYVFK